MSAGKQLLDPPDLAAILGVEVTWIYTRTHSKAKDPIPRCKGIGRLKFNPRAEDFKEWLARNFGPLDLGVGDE
jgi:hypothetical protein